MSEQPVKTGKKLGTTQIILIAGFVILVAVVCVFGWLMLKEKETATGGDTARTAAAGTGNVVADEENIDDVIAKLKEKAAEGMFEVKMNSTWNFPDGTSPSIDAYVANSTANHKPIYFTVSLDDGTVVYTSPIIPLGSAVKEFALTEDLDAGNYEGVCTYYLLNEDETVFSSTSVVVRLQVAQ